MSTHKRQTRKREEEGVEEGGGDGNVDFDTSSDRLNVMARHYFMKLIDAKKMRPCLRESINE